MIVDGQSYGANGSAARNAPSALSSDFNTFLRMLTVQMQNQDPLNPMSSTDFAVQLATFSQVEQQVRANDLLEGLSAQIAEVGLSQLASWIQLEARVAAPITPTGKMIELAFAADPSADSAVVSVRNMQGQVVQQIPVTRQQTNLWWSGEGLPAGSYQFELISYLDGAKIKSGPVDHYAKVEEASSLSGGVTLTLATGTSVAASAVASFRAPKG